MINFTKMHGLGNDYIYINRLNGKNVIDNKKIPSFIRYVCNRNFGVGADGVIFVDDSKISDFKMTIYNQDGTQAEMCGNGIRCFAKYVYDNRVTTKTEITIETLAGIKQAYVTLKSDRVESIKICMGEPKLLNQTTLKADDSFFNITNVSMGNPHAVIYVNSVDDFNVHKYGPLLENNNFFPNRTNVEFVQIIDRGNVKMRVWERGSGETMACGTGACAAAVASHINEYTRRDVIVLLRGGELKINWDKNTNKVFMEGIATKVFDGEIDENNI